MDPIVLLSWNVCGLNTRARRDVVRVLLQDTRASVVCLQETKLSLVDVDVIQCMCGSQFKDFAYLPAADTRGGALVACHQDVASFSDVSVRCFSVTIKISPCSGEPSWWLTTVYGPQEDDDKVLFLEELEATRAACAGP